MFFVGDNNMLKIVFGDVEDVNHNISDVRS